MGSLLNFSRTYGVSLGVIALSACAAVDQQPLATGSALAPAIAALPTQTMAVAAAMLTQASPGATSVAPKPSETIPQQSSSIRHPTQRMTGFSPDSKYYLHLESWRDPGAGIPHAKLQVVELAANACVTQGCVSTGFGEGAAGLGLDAAENQVLQQTQALRQALQLLAPIEGVRLPILERSQTADGAETVMVQFAINRPPLEIQLRQKGPDTPMTGGIVAGEKAAMQLEIRYLGRQRSLKPLEPLRETSHYAIREVLLAPDRKTFVVLITATQPDFEGQLGTTLVQGFELAQ